MNFYMKHVNINVKELDKSAAFYEKALGMRTVRRKEASDGSFILAYLTDPEGDFQLELTWLRDKTGGYDLGDNESHIAFAADDYDAAYALHKGMGAICYENPDMGIYFIEDPDGYWIEIIPGRPKNG